MIRSATGRSPRGRGTPLPTAPRWALVAGGAAAAWVLTGCSFAGSVEDAGAATSTPTLSTAGPSPSSAEPGGTPSAASPTTPSSGSSTAASSGAAGAPTGASTSTAAGAGGGAGSGGGGGTGACRTSDLALSLLPGEGGGSAGHQHYTIQFTNRGSASCTLDGHPGVSLVTGDSGQQLGAAASREGTPAAVRLGPGASAYADVSLAEAEDYDSAQCQPQAARGLRVYPPDQTASAFVAADGLTGCASSSVVLLVVDPVVAGR